jgi:hypothetical protein
VFCGGRGVGSLGSVGQFLAVGGSDSLLSDLFAIEF